MDLRLSVLARDRAFSRGMHRIRPRLQPLLDAFRQAELQHPIHEAILVSVTDVKEPGFVQEIENDDGFFQVIIGCRTSRSDDELVRVVFEILLQAVRLCPFSTPDHEMFERLFEKMRQGIVE
jgi:hypothetical protein